MDNIILQKTWVQGSPVIVDNLLGTAFTGEAQAHTFVVSGVDAAQEPVTITGTITGKFLAANNVTVPLTGSLVNGAASVTLTDECYDVPGRYILSIYATNGETTQCLYCAVGNVFRTDSQTIAYPSTDLPNITTLMAQLEEILDGWPADYSQLQSDVSSLKSAIKTELNSYDKFILSNHAEDLLTNNGAVYYSTGGDNNSVAGSYKRSDYIRVYKGYYIEYASVSMVTTLDIIAVYDTDKNYVQAESVTVSSNTANAKGNITLTRDGYIRISCHNERIGVATFTISDKVGVKSVETVRDINRLSNFGIPHNISAKWIVGWISSSTGEVQDGTSGIITPEAVTLTGDIIVRKIRDSNLQIYKYSGGSFTRTGVNVGDSEYRFTADPDATYRFCYYRYPYETATVDTFINDFAVGYASDNSKFATSFSSVSGKKWVTMGDSLTDNVTLSDKTGDEAKNYTQIVAERLGLTLSNQGVSGSGYWRKSTVSPYKGFYQVAQTIPTDANIVTIFGSFNDMGTDGDISGRTILGTIYDDTTATVGGCINQAIQNLITRVPDAVIGIILPTPWNAMTQTSAEMETYEPYVNLVKGVAERYSLPVLDLFHHSNLRPWDSAFKSEYYISPDDGVHPNHYGHMRIAGYIADFVESLASLI